MLQHKAGIGTNGILVVVCVHSDGSLGPNKRHHGSTFIKIEYIEWAAGYFHGASSGSCRQFIIETEQLLRLINPDEQHCREQNLRPTA
jgi:hypothetical protein